MAQSNLLAALEPCFCAITSIRRIHFFVRYWPKKKKIWGKYGTFSVNFAYLSQGNFGKVKGSYIHSKVIALISNLIKQFVLGNKNKVLSLLILLWYVVPVRHLSPDAMWFAFKIVSKGTSKCPFIACIQRWNMVNFRTLMITTI